MDERVLLVRVEADEAGTLRALAPAVGYWIDPPRAGVPVGAGARVGRLLVLNRRYTLRLPDGVAGYVEGALPADRRTAVGYGQELFALAPLEAARATGTRAVAARAGEAGLPEGARAIVSPTDGTFYRRPTPGAAPFVEVGHRIAAGQPVGLVEVMKTFNQVLYGGPGLPEQVEVLEVRAEDAQEVHAGQVLVVVR